MGTTVRNRMVTTTAVASTLAQATVSANALTTSWAITCTCSSRMVMARAAGMCQDTRTSLRSRSSTSLMLVSSSQRAIVPRWTTLASMTTLQQMLHTLLVLTMRVWTASSGITWGHTTGMINMAIASMLMLWLHTLVWQLLTLLRRIYLLRISTIPTSVHPVGISILQQ